MIHFIRTYFTRRYLTKIILLITLLSLVGVGSVAVLFKSFFGKAYQEDIVAQVNGYAIGLGEYRQKIAEEERRISYLRKQFGSQASLFFEAMGIKSRPEEQALQDLIREKLLLSCADELGIQVSAEELSRSVQDPMFLVQALGDIVVPYLVSEQGSIDYDRLLDFLRRQGMPIDKFRQVIENHIKQKMVLFIAENGFYIPKQMIVDRFKKDFLKKKFMILSLPLSSFEKQAHEKAVDNKELKRYFDEHAGSYQIQEKRTGSAWIIPLQTYDITVTDKDIQDYYMRNKKNFIAQEEKKDSSGKIVQPLVYKDLTDVKDDIKNKVKLEKSQRIFNLESQAILTQEKNNPGALATFLEKKHARTIDLHEVSADSSSLRTRLFKLLAGEKISFVDSKDGVILMLDSITMKSPRSFEDAKPDVLKDWYHDEARRTMVEELHTLLHKQSLWKEKAKVFGGKVTTTSWIDPAQEESWQPFHEQKIPLEKVTGLANEGDSIYEVGSHHGYLISLTAMDPLNASEFDTHALELRNRIAKEEQGFFDKAFIDSLTKNAKIDVNKGTFTYSDW